MEVASYHKLLFVTDAAINIAPDLGAKLAIIANAARAARALGLVLPKVALLAAVEKVNYEKMPCTVEAADHRADVSAGASSGAASSTGPSPWTTRSVTRARASRISVRKWPATRISSSPRISRRGTSSTSASSIYGGRQGRRHRDGRRGSHRAHEQGRYGGDEARLHRFRGLGSQIGRRDAWHSRVSW